MRVPIYMSAVSRGAAKEQMTKVTYICRSAKNKVVTYSIFFLFYFLCFWGFLGRFFGRIVTRGVQKHGFFFEKSIWAHHKKCGFFPLRPPPPPSFSFGCFVRFFLSRFWAFRNKGSSKTRLKKIARRSPQPPKKVVTYLRHFFFPAAPLASCKLQGARARARTWQGNSAPSDLENSS
jgi:hypothetical protein